MGKIIETRNLYKNTINSITQNADNWLSFLKTASWNFKYSFEDQILIYAQNPNATACAEMEYWNEKLHRWVNKNANAIFVFSKDDNNPYPFRLVFDREDTHNYRGTSYKIWEMKEEYTEEIIETLENSFGEIEDKTSLAETIIQTARNIVFDNIPDYLVSIHKYKQNSSLEKLTENEIESIVTANVFVSVANMMLSRCNIDPNKYIAKTEYAEISKFNNQNIITILGTAISDMAEVGLREIARTVDNLQKEEKNRNRTFVENQKQKYSNNKERNEGGIENGENRIHESRGLQHTKSSNEQGNSRNAIWKIRSNEATLPKEREESRVHNIENEQPVEHTFERNSRDGNTNDRADSREVSQTRRNDRGIERKRPNEMGRSNEQLQDNSGGTSDERSNLQLDILTEEEQKQKIAEVENTSVFSFTQERIDNVLKEGTGVVNGKFRIYEQLVKGLSNKENAEFLKNEYGLGGRSANENGISEEHNSKGIKLSNIENNSSLLLNWNEVEKRIQELISADRYFTETEKEEYIKWIEKEDTTDLEETETEKEVETEKQYIYSIGDRVNIGTDEFEIVNINEKEVSIADVTFPMLVKQISYEEFDRKVKENPFNDHLIITNRKDISIEENTKKEKAKTSFEKWLDRFIEEKGIDLDYIITIETNENTHYFEIGNIIDNIKRTSKEEQTKIKDTIVKIDFNNGDIIDYFKELARALANNYDKEIKEPEYYVGQEVYLEQDHKFRIDEINKEKGTINLLDLKLASVFPIFREETIENFERLYYANSLNKTEVPKENQEDIIAPKIKKKRRNRIEYFDLHPEIPMQERNNYLIQDEILGEGTKKEKFQRNIEAIKILQKCEKENRYATVEEQSILGKYTGWGGIPEAFDSRNSAWTEEYEELKSLLTEKEYKEARESTLTAFYTPPIIMKAMYKALENMGLQRGNILEPSCRYWEFYGYDTSKLK